MLLALSGATGKWAGRGRRRRDGALCRDELPGGRGQTATITARLDTLRSDIFGVLEDLQRTAGRLLDHVLAE